MITPNSVMLFFYAFIFFDIITIAIFYISYLFKKRKLLLIGLVLEVLAFNISLINLQLYYSDTVLYSDPANTLPLIEFKKSIDMLLIVLMGLGYFEVLGKTKINDIVVINNKLLWVFILLSLVIFQTVFFYNMWL